MFRILVLVCLVTVAHAAQVRLFLLSGQSNMKRLDPATGFTPAIQAAFPEDEIVVVHVANSGQLISKWVPDWQPPEGMTENAKGRPVRTARSGQLYQRLIEEARQAMEGKPDPVSISFCWHQGEADAGAGYQAVYETSLRKVYAQLQADFGRQDITMVIARISDFSLGTDEERPGWQAIRDIHVKIAESMPLADWVDTDDLNGETNGLHYPDPSYTILGQRLAEKTIALIKQSAK